MTTTKLDPKIVLHSIEQALFSAYRQSWETRQIRGSLDPRRAYRSLCGSSDVFRRKDIQEARTSAVSLVVDLSGSMGGGAGHALGRMVDGFAEIFKGTQTNWELSGFSRSRYDIGNGNFTRSTERPFDPIGNSHKHREAIASGESTKVTTTAEPRRYGKEQVHRGNVVRFKAFGKKAKSSYYQIIQQTIHGGTCDAQVYRLAAQRLAKQEESTKLLIYLGDGEGDGMPYIAGINETAKQDGVISFGIGLGVDARTAVQPWAFDTHVQVDDADNLSMEAFNASAQVIKQLRKERCK